MNAVEEGGNQFSQLFEKMPAKRVGRPEDIAGAILYLCSQAGVSMSIHLTSGPSFCVTTLADHYF
jgi:NAD(P)-dependent dehydrogenase (short-subunit alcohol dehydrogenase family)